MIVPDDPLPARVRIAGPGRGWRAGAYQLKGDYAASVKEYDHVVQHILGMADRLSSGIIAQFPSKFDKK